MVIAPVLQALLEKECAAVHGQRLEQAISKFIGAHHELLPKDEHPAQVALIPNKISNHIMAHMALVRNLIIEDDNTTSGGRRYAKTGGFRRKAGPDTWRCLAGLMALMRAALPSAPPAAPEAEPGPVGGSRASAAEDRAAEEPDVPEVLCCENGWPLIFQQIITSEAGVAQPEPPVESELYDDDGYPIVATTSATRVEVEERGVAERLDDSKLAAVTPVRGERKRLAKGRPAASGTGRLLNKGKAADSTPKPKTKGAARPTPAKDNDKDKDKGKDKEQLAEMCAPIKWSKVSGPTKEDDPRVELTGVIELHGVPKRIHIFTLKHSKHGKGCKRFVDSIGRQIDQDHISKKQCLEARALEFEK